MSAIEMAMQNQSILTKLFQMLGHRNWLSYLSTADFWSLEPNHAKWLSLWLASGLLFGRFNDLPVCEKKNEKPAKNTASFPWQCSLVAWHDALVAALLLLLTDITSTHTNKNQQPPSPAPFSRQIVLSKCRQEKKYNKRETRNQCQS